MVGSQHLLMMTLEEKNLPDRACVTIMASPYCQGKISEKLEIHGREDLLVEISGKDLLLEEIPGMKDQHLDKISENGNDHVTCMMTRGHVTLVWCLIEVDLLQVMVEEAHQENGSMVKCKLQESILVLKILANHQ